ncbi:OsmC family protein [Sandaracinobacter neustonicus]|uniref:OsmC family protein n=1 Tax=Sandaracinobacter neustonicus TaxID=1715348 RepID=A0A501XMC0_9SPHN|nr:OsmC family protein [Sandaracinobacter neustonicus]TPE61740.1 OsmC family protein [Sandaracinobacter neustonicus]
MAHATAHIAETAYRTEISTGRHSLIADEPPALGGQGAGPAPYDLLLASLGACTAITLRMYAERKGWPLQSLDVKLKLSGTEDRRIERVLLISGLDDAQKARLSEIAERTPVTLTLKSGLPIETMLG